MNIVTPPINFYYVGSAVLLIVGFYIVVDRPNLIKKIIGINIMETAVFLFLIAIGSAQGNTPPLYQKNAVTKIYVNPFPQFMVIMGIMVTLGVTTFGLGLIIRIYQRHGTIDADKLVKLLGENDEEDGSS